MGIRDKALKWYNQLSRAKREELSIDYYGSTSLFDMEIVDMYFEEVPHNNLEETVSLLRLFAEKFVANTETAYKKKEIKEWIDENLIS